MIYLISDPLPHNNICWSHGDVLSMSGCGQNCAATIHNIGEFDILSYHYYFTQLPKTAKKQWILDYLHTHSTSDGDITFIISGKQVCQDIWIATLGVSVSWFYKIRQLSLKGSLRMVTAPKQVLQKTYEAVEWMRQYFELIGDYMPHRMVVHLPSFLSKISVYHKMISHFKLREKQHLISKSQFFLLWKKHFGHVTIPSVSCLILRCYLIFIVHILGK